MFPFRGHGEEGIEGDHSIYFRYGDIEFGSDDALHLFGQVAVQVLRFVQNIDYLARVDSVLLSNRSDLFCHIAG